MFSTEQEGWAAGYVRTAAPRSNVEHLVIEGWHFTLCGRQVLYTLRHMRLKDKCRRCQWEASKRVTSPSDKP